MTPTGFVQLVEGRLGWENPYGKNKPEWQQHMVPARMVKTKMAQRPSLYTWKNLLLAVELLAREEKTRSPMDVFDHIERALDLAMVPDTDVEVAINDAVRYETQRGDPDGWAVRFARCSGGYRLFALQEWRGTLPAGGV